MRVRPRTDIFGSGEVLFLRDVPVDVPEDVAADWFGRGLADPYQTPQRMEEEPTESTPPPARSHSVLVKPPKGKR